MGIKGNLFFVQDLGSLFEDVQLGKVFEDQKFFTDAVPKIAPKEIVKYYEVEKKQHHFKLFDFCERYFDFPESNATGFVSDRSKTVEEHINILWDLLTKKTDNKGGTLIGLPNPFVVPGGRFREVYYWDSYFTMLGLQVSGKTGLIENMVANFAYLIDQYGFIPNGNRSYFLSRSQPPFFSLMLELLSEEKGETQLIKYLPQLEREYQFWMMGMEGLDKMDMAADKHVVRMREGEILNRYWDQLDSPREESFLEDLETAKGLGKEGAGIFRHIRAAAASGWDFSSRWFRDENKMASIHTTDIVPIDLNCLLHHLETVLAKGFLLMDKKEVSEKYRGLANKRLAAIQKYLWDEKAGIFVDYDFIENRPTGRMSAAMVYPLFLNMATKDQGNSVVKKLEKDFLKPGGLLTTLSFNGQQWDAPNGWAPLQWAGFKGAMDYGFDGFAKKIKSNWTGTVEAVFKSTGKLTEKYNVVETAIAAGGGEYPNQDGFGWTNGVYLKLKSIA